MGIRQSKLHVMFEKVRVASRGLEDGKAWWAPKKEFLKSTDSWVFATSWKPIDDALHDKIMSLPEFDEEKKMIEVHHFIIQQVRLPRNELPVLRRIIQIALNIGQLEGRASPEFLKSIDYKNSGLNKLETYISDDDIEFISRQLNSVFLDAFYKLL